MKARFIDSKVLWAVCIERKEKHCFVKETKKGENLWNFKCLYFVPSCMALIKKQYYIKTTDIYLYKLITSAVDRCTLNYLIDV